MIRIARHRLRVADTAELAGFYTGLLGMRTFGTAEAPLFGYDEAECLIAFEGGAVPSRTVTRQDFYWKIGITVRDLDHAVAFLRRQGWPVSDPRQFRDIGYLCHLNDPQGFAIELLQQGFEGRHSAAGEGHPVGGQATLAHITLRVNDIDAAQADCERLGLHLISVQPVNPFGFCLYFFAGVQETLPIADLAAVGNREWLWARPYALLELQHVFAGDVRPPDGNEAAEGFAGFALRDPGDGALRTVRPSDMAGWI